MAQLKCSICGGEREYIQGEGWVCQSCGNTIINVELSDQAVDKLDKANSLRDRYFFEDALIVCNEVLREEPNNAEANWCALLAEYKIVYLKNDKGIWTATFLDPDASPVPMTRSKYFSKLNRTQQDEIFKIEEARQKAINDGSKIPPYDVFISYKQHVSGSSSALTNEAKWADELYKLLTKKKLRVFLDRYSLGGRIGWEAHIFAAIRSAKYMVVLGSSLNNIEAPWVKNEWTRFAYLQKHDINKKLQAAVPYGSVRDRMRLDEKLRNTQIIDTDQPDWKDNLISDILAVVDSNVNTVRSLLLKADEYIRHGKFKKAKKLYEDIINRDPKNVYALWGIVRCKYKAFDNYDIVKSRKLLDKYAHNEFNYVIDAGDDKSDRRFYKIKDDQIKHDTTGYERNNYLAYRKNSKVKRVFKKIFTAVAVVAVGAFGVYSYIGISYPVKYNADNGGATLSGKSLYCNFVLKDLNVDTYKDYPVVKIGENALKGSKIETVKLADSVEEIGEGAFANNKKLTTVSIANTSIAIGDYAFENCVNLNEFVVGEQIEAKTVAYYASEPMGLNTVSGITIGDYAFANCKSLKSLQLNNCKTIGGNAFNGCTSLETLYLDIDNSTKFSADALAKIGKNVTINIPTVAENAYSKLKTEYSDLNIVTYTKDKVEECIYFIAKLGVINKDNLKDMEHAEKLYNNLSAAEKSKVNNYGVLQNARAAWNAVEAINAIGKVTLDSGVAISNAENLYNILTSEQKNAVANYETLTTARAVYNVMKQISDIGSVAISSEPDILVAENAYNALTYEQRDMVTNYVVLTEARIRVDTLLANAATDKINAIGAVITLDSESLITVAETAYSNLTEAQKSKVNNYTVLTDARAIFNTMKAIGAIGEITLQSGALISVAESMYGALTTAQKLKVANYSDLADAKSVYPVVLQISTISIVMPDSNAAIQAVESAYANLTVQQQVKVSNYSALVDLRAAYSVVELISEIGSVTLEKSLYIESVQNSFNALSVAQKSLVGNSDELTTAVSALTGIVEGKITAIGFVMPSSLSKIEEAERAYEKLTDLQKSAVKNYSVLTDSLAAYATVVLIDKIDKITANNVPVFKEANNSYDGLTSSQKSLVGNYEKLANATKAYDVFVLIENIGTVTINSGSDINKAELGYGNLSSVQKGMVSNYGTLTAARNRLDNLFAENAINKINRIPSDITVNAEDTIKEAETYYNNLSSNQKSLVTNYYKLSDAIAKLDVAIQNATMLSVLRTAPEDKWLVKDGYKNGYNLNGAGYISNGYQIKIDVSSLDVNYIKKHQKNIKLSMEMWVWEYDDGYQEIYIYNAGVSASEAQSGKVAPIAGLEFEHVPGKKGGTPYRYLFTTVISASAITGTELWIAFDAFGEGDDDWGCSELIFKVEATNEQETKMYVSKIQ